MTRSDQSQKRLLGIVGSPRRGGNTDCLTDKVLAGARAAGARGNKVYLSKLKISPCRACEACKKAGRCIQKDDMPAVLEKMEKSDIWIFGTPVYFWGPTGWFKAFVDRFYGAREHLDFQSKRVILIVPFEDKEIETARHTVGMIEDTLNYLKIKLQAKLVVPGVLGRGEVNDRLEILSEAWQIGKDAAIAQYEECCC